jgi:hypothetical protein
MSKTVAWNGAQISMLSETEGKYYKSSLYLKMTALWDIAPCSLVEFDWRFRGEVSHCPDDGGSKDLWNVGKLVPDHTALQPRRQSLIALMMEAARTSETLVNVYQTTRCYNPEDSHLRMVFFYKELTFKLNHSTQVSQIIWNDQNRSNHTEQFRGINCFQLLQSGYHDSPNNIRVSVTITVSFCRRFSRQVSNYRFARLWC